VTLPGSHEVRGLAEKARPVCSGLFGYIGKSCTVKNLHFVSADIKGGNTVGGISGVNEGAVMSTSHGVGRNLLKDILARENFCQVDYFAQGIFAFWQMYPLTNILT
jgi:hypothetical protein